MPDHIKQLALGCLNHESITRRFPTGGWGWAWGGDPDRGNDWRRPGGWIYNVLSYMEQQPLHDLGKGLALGSQAKLDAGTQRIATPIRFLNCPTRRQATVYPWPSSYVWWTFATNIDTSSTTHAYVARSDYAACGGEYLDLRRLATCGPEPVWRAVARLVFGRLHVCRWPIP